MPSRTAHALLGVSKPVIFLVAIAWLVNGCAVLDLANPQSPTVRLESIKPKQLGGRLQQLELGLIVENPNRFDLQISGLDFTALINGEKFASGSSDQSVNVPGLGEALLQVEVVLGLTELFSQASKLLSSPNEGPLVYGVTGSVDLENWPSAIPFNVTGEYTSPLQ